MDPEMIQRIQSYGKAYLSLVGRFEKPKSICYYWQCKSQVDEESSSGRTADSGSAGGGSNPPSSAILLEYNLLRILPSSSRKQSSIDPTRRIRLGA